MLKTSEIRRLIDEDRSSGRMRDAELGRRYYDGQHDILNYKLYYYDAKGQLIEDTSRSNIKICHPFFTEIVDQCVQYLLSGKNQIVRSDEPLLNKELNSYFGDDFRAELAETLTDVCVGGFGYMYAYKGADDKTKFVYADAMGVVEVRAKDTDDSTQYVIYWYKDRADKEKKQITRIQVWDDRQVTYFVQEDNGNIFIDESEPINPRPHIVYTKSNEEGRYGDALGYIPFIRCVNNRKQVGHLPPIKALIDDYDLMACSLSNNLQDVTEALYVVRGLQGDNLDELIQNIRTKKTIGVDSEGGIDIKTIDLPYEARIKKLEIDEKNVYRFGMAFNNSMIGDGNITNVVIKSRYALLDLKTNKLETRVRAFMQELVKIALDEINEEHNTGFTLDSVYIEFQREIMTNASDNADVALKKAQEKQVEINTLLNLGSYLDNETLMQSVCEVLEIEYEDIKDRLPNPDGEYDELIDTLNTAEVV